MKWVESNVHYQGCTFYSVDSSIEDSIFDNCSFRNEASFSNLRGCRFNNCGFSEGLHLSLSETNGKIPDYVFGITDLTHLRIVWGDIKILPKEIIRLKNLEVLDLHLNLLTSIPNEVSHLKKLKILNLSSNAASLFGPYFSEDHKQEIRSWLPSCEVIFETSIPKTSN
ncbi:hypothetical protein [Candidatus Uabimicrobium sp. HlEnr_7]|uniref:hypothetical protein n=1 Tax=Candidatus Uabimicrobium helgolandensis TaxID=3095367 RepID=UPI0035591C2A